MAFPDQTHFSLVTLSTNWYNFDNKKINQRRIYFIHIFELFNDKMLVSKIEDLCCRFQRLASSFNTESYVILITSSSCVIYDKNKSLNY